MKNLVLVIAILVCSCAQLKELDEYEPFPAMLVRVERIERFSAQFGEMRVVQKKQTWEFLLDHFKIVEYVDTTNREEIGIIARKDRRK